MRVTKSGKYDYNAGRNRKRFKAIWIGETDELGYMTHGKVYRIAEVTKSGHYRFLNNFKADDFAHSSWFQIVSKPLTLTNFSTDNKRPRLIKSDT